MKALNPLALQDFRESVVTLAVCWRVEKATGEFVLGCEHDRNLTVAATDPYILAQWPTADLTGTYLAATGISGSDVKSSSDMSADNMEIVGALDSTPGLPGVSGIEIESGTLDHAPVVVFVVNWKAPDRWQVITRRGHLGEWYRDSDGLYRSEVRGLLQLFSQNIGRTNGVTCDVVDFGDARCKLNVAAITRTGIVTAVVSRKAYTVDLTPSTTPPVPTYFYLGKQRFTSGDNNGFMREAKKAVFTAGSIAVETWEEWPADIEIGDTMSIEPGCDRRPYETCRDVHNNLINVRAPGIFIPRIADLTKGPLG